MSAGSAGRELQNLKRRPPDARLHPPRAGASGGGAVQRLQLFLLFRQWRERLLRRLPAELSLLQLWLQQSTAAGQLLQKRLLPMPPSTSTTSTLHPSSHRRAHPGVVAVAVGAVEEATRVRVFSLGDLLNVGEFKCEWECSNMANGIDELVAASLPTLEG